MAEDSDDLQSQENESPKVIGGIATNRLADQSTYDYYLSLIIVVKDLKPEAKVVHDETIVCNSLQEAKEKQAEIQKRRTDNKRRIVICQQMQDSRNFSDFKQL